MNLNIHAARSALMADILDLSRQNRLEPLTPHFNDLLLAGIVAEDYLPVDRIEALAEHLTNRLSLYREQTKASTVVLGMSGGVDSAVVAALFKRAGYRVIGATMPIHQNPEETDRGVEACQALGLEHIHADLTDAYDATLTAFQDILAKSVVSLTGPRHEIAVNIRKGNLRARTRMFFLYNLAHEVGGFVASTDNFSELVAGFWTLHGDVGDVAPVQSLLKSWEIPALARYLGVPETTWRATPTDGLGISNGDEAQLGCSYLEWDLATLEIRAAVYAGYDDREGVIRFLEGQYPDMCARDRDIYDAVLSRTGGTWHKRANPINFEHPFKPRLEVISMIDHALFVPPAAK